MKLVITNKNYSSWSLRSWLLLRHAGIAFDEEKISLIDPRFHAKLRAYSPAGRVPVLIDDGFAIWDSLAIAEYVADRFPDHQLWPADRQLRARARSLCAEMHAGFAALRTSLPMNCELRVSNVLFDNAVRCDISRVIDAWNECREAHAAAGPFLFGRFSIADAYFAPVACRFASYGVQLPEVSRAYCATIEGLPAMQAWRADAAHEHEFVPDDEPYREPPQPA